MIEVLLAQLGETEVLEHYRCVEAGGMDKAELFDFYHTWFPIMLESHLNTIDSWDEERAGEDW